MQVEWINKETAEINPELQHVDPNEMLNLPGEV